MNDSHIPPASAPVRAHLHVGPSGYRFATELVKFTVGDELVGCLTLPREQAYDLVSRLEDTPPSLTLITSEVAGHVRYVLDGSYQHTEHEPPPWLFELILLIKDADEEHRRRLARAYPDYVVAVAIATGTDGLDALGHLHTELMKSETRTSAPAAAQGE